MSRLAELHAMSASLAAFNAGIAGHFAARHHYAAPPVKPKTMKRVPPPNTDDKPEYLHDSDLGELMCWFEHEPAEPSTDSPLVWNLTHAWLGDVNVAHCLPDWVVKEIERDALIEFEEQQLEGDC